MKFFSDFIHESKFNRKLLILLGLLFALIGIGLIVLVKPGWTLLDDPTFVMAGHESIARHGFVDGVIAYFDNLVHTDLGIGRLRLLFILWATLFYALIPIPALAVSFKFAIVVFATLIPCFFLKKKNASPALLLCLVFILYMSPAYWDSIVFTSLQEFLGLPFIALAILFADKKKYLVTSFLLYCAAMGKEPYVWVLICWGLILISIARRQGMITLILGLGHLGFGIYLAKHGSYSNRILHPSLEVMLDSATNRLFSYGGGGVLCFLFPFATYLYQRLKTVKSRALDSSEAMGLALFVGGGIYLMTIFVWGGGLYHFAPPLYLLSVGLIVFWGACNRGLPLSALNVFIWGIGLYFFIPSIYPLAIGLVVLGGLMNSDSSIPDRIAPWFVICAFFSAWSVSASKVTEFNDYQKNVRNLEAWYDANRQNFSNICTDAEEVSFTLPKLNHIRRRYDLTSSEALKIVQNQDFIGCQFVITGNELAPPRFHVIQAGGFKIYKVD